MNLTRRGFLGGLLAVVSAPAIVRVENLMPVRAEIIKPTIDLITNTTGFQVGDIISLEGGEEFVATYTSNSMLTVNAAMREAVRAWTNSNAFIKSIDEQYDREFAAGQARIGDTVRIKLPNDFTIGEGHQFA